MYEFICLHFVGAMCDLYEDRLRQTSDPVAIAILQERLANYKERYFLLRPFN